MSQKTVVQPTPLAKPNQTKHWFSLDNRFVPPVFITTILLVGHLSFGILESYQRTLLAIAVSILAELILGRIFFHQWPHLASAYITGISVGILVRSPAYWPYALCSLLAITSKYVLRVKGRHIWNPSNFGICAMLFLASDSVATLSIQWGNNLWAMLVIWLLGSAIIWRLRRFHICAVYVLSFCALSFVRSWITGDPWLFRGLAYYRPGISTLHFFHDYRSQDYSEVKNGAVCGYLLRCGRRDVFSSGPEHLHRSTHCSA